MMPNATNVSYAALVWSGSLSAGAITSANRIGVSSGTHSSRGVRVVSWKRRPASVARGSAGVRWRRVRGTVEAMVAIEGSPLVWKGKGRGAPCRDGSGRLGQPAAGEPQVDVVEGRPTDGERSRPEPELVDGGDRAAGGSVQQRDRDRRTDGER